MKKSVLPLSETIGGSSARPPHGMGAILLAALLLGILLMGLQLWLLTIALDLYLSGQTAGIWELAALSGVIFLGGVLLQMALRKTITGPWNR